MMYKTILVLLIPFAALGQTKKKMHTNLAFGAAVTSQLNNSVTTGLSMLTGIEYHFSEKWAVWTIADFQTFTYTKTESDYSLKDKISLLPLTTGVYYSFLKKRISAYLLAGGGFTVLTVPDAEINSITNYIQIKKENKILPSVQAGVGIKWKLNALFMPFLEPKITSSFGMTSIAKNNLTTTSFVIGFRSEFF